MSGESINKPAVVLNAPAHVARPDLRGLGVSDASISRLVAAKLH